MEELIRKIDQLERRLNTLVPMEVPYVAGGSFAPTWLGTTTAGSYTYVTQTGFWRQVDDYVSVALRLDISAITVNPAGNMRITGMSALPLPVSSNPFRGHLGLMSNTDLNASRLGLTFAFISEGGETRLELREYTDNGGSAQWTAALMISSLQPMQMALEGWYVAA